jgi:hypothetical protein
LVATSVQTTIAELESAVTQWRADFGTAAKADRRVRRALLRDLHDLLMAAAPGLTDPPHRALLLVADTLRAAPPDAVMALVTRRRVVMRLLRSGAVEAAWEVLLDNAAAADVSVPRSRRLPLVTRVEGARAFADLAGFRDPRYAAPDDCYEITNRLRLGYELEELEVSGATVTIGGWAALDQLGTGPEEQVRLLLARSAAAATAAAGEGDGDGLTIVGTRHRRSDLWTGPGEAGRLRIWAGWSAAIDLLDPRLSDGSWWLSLELRHAGMVRRVPIGGEETSELAAALAGEPTHVNGRTLRWRTDGPQWSISL